MDDKINMETSNEISTSATLENQTNPLLVHEVIKCLFRYLNLRDIKTCRSVCLTWNDIAEPFLRRRSVITFRSQPSVNFLGSLLDFTETFNNSQSNLPFPSFRFTGMNMQISEFQDFMHSNRRNIKELYLQELRFEKSVFYDISVLISHYCISTLSINLKGKGYPFLSVSLHQLNLVKSLELIGCEVKVRDGIRISPTRLTLASVLFCQGANVLPRVRVNDYFNVENAKEISLSCSHSSARSALFLDLGDKSFKEIDELSLNLTGLKNWDISKCNVNSLRINQVMPILQNTRMQIKKLYFKNASIDLAILPQGIQEISFECGFITSDILCSRPIFLQNLNTLSLSSGDGFVVLHHFLNCESLVNLNLTRTYGYEANDNTIDSDWIPKSVRKIKMQGIRNIIGNSFLNVENLILEHYTLADSQRILENIKPTSQLVINWMKMFELDDDALSFLQNNLSVEKVYLGPFAWSEARFSSSQLAQKVDKMADYYVFENLKGNAIENYHIPK